MDVLAGAKNLLCTAACKVLVELHPDKILAFGATSQQLVQFFLEHHFQIYRVMNFRSHHWEPQLVKITQPVSFDLQEPQVLLYAVRR
jgi:hypothetical protein